MQPVRCFKTDGSSFCLCREERQSLFIKTVQFLVHRSILSRMLSAIHRVTNSQWSTMHSTPTNCVTRKNDKTYGQLNSHARRRQPSICSLRSVTQSDWIARCRGAHLLTQTPEKGALLGHREQTDKQRDMDIPAFFLINTGPFIPTIYLA